MRDSGSSALSWAAGISGVLALVKLGVGIWTGSMLLMASAADSAGDALMSALNGLGRRWSISPADHNHPFGHGKLEGALALAQMALMLALALSVVAGAVGALVKGGGVEQGQWAIWTLIASGAFSALITAILSRSSQDSLVVNADTAHYRTDLVSAAASALGLGLAIGFNRPALDAIFAILAAIWMGMEALKVGRMAVRELLDEVLPDEELRAIEGVMKDYADLVVGFHDLKTRKAGSNRFIELHVSLPPEMLMGDAHLLIHDLTRALMHVLPGAIVTLHTDAAGYEDVDIRIG